MIAFAIIAAAFIVLGVATLAGILLYAIVKLSEGEGFYIDNADYMEDEEDE